MSYIDPQKKAALIKAGHTAGEIHRQVAELVLPGTNLLTIEQFIRQRIAESGLESAFLNYKGYPAVSCLSINEEIVHGIPTDRVLEEGDTLAVDLGVKCDGWCVDTARTHPVGEIDRDTARLLSVTEKALTEAIKVARPGNRIGDIGATVQLVIEKAGFSIIEELTGHGVGKTLQEPPNIPNYGQKGKGVLLEPGMVLAIEPITAVLPVDIAILADGWTIVATPPCPTAHFEHTILITEAAPLILTA